ncbi:MAG: hypothetical protein AB1486_16525 [Planctomycetota bacterium]
MGTRRGRRGGGAAEGGTLRDLDLLVVAEGGLRAELRRAFTGRVRRCRVSAHVDRVPAHLAASLKAAAVIDWHLLSGEVARLLDEAGAATAVVLIGEEPSAGRPLPVVPTGKGLAERLLAALEQTVTAARQNWVEAGARRVIEGCVLAELSTGEPVAAWGLGSELLGTEALPGPGREACLKTLAALAELVPVPHGRMGEFAVPGRAGMGCVAWRASVSLPRELTPGALCLALCDQTVGLRGLSQRGQAQWLEAAASIAEELAHDFNNVLQAILSGLDLLRVDLGYSEAVREAFLEPIERAAEGGVTLTRRVLTLTRARLETHRPFDLDELVDDCLQRLAGAPLPPSRLERAQRARGAGRLVIDGDREQLGEALQGLLEFAQRLGLPVRVWSGCEGPPRGGAASPDAEPTFAHLVIDVAVAGGATRREVVPRGVETEALPKLATLATAVAYRVVQRHEGSLEVESTPESACRVRVSLPLFRGRTKAPPGEF